MVSKENHYSKLNLEQLYIQKYKPIAIILKIFSRTILSNLVNLSVLDSYCDPDLTYFLDNIFKIIINIPSESITYYVKVY